MGAQGLYLRVHGLHLAAKGLHLAAQSLHLAAQGLHLAAQGLRWVTQGLHLVAQGLHLAAQGLQLGCTRVVQTLAYRKHPEIRVIEQLTVGFAIARRPWGLLGIPWAVLGTILATLSQAKRQSRGLWADRSQGRL